MTCCWQVLPKLTFKDAVVPLSFLLGHAWLEHQNQKPEKSFKTYIMLLQKGFENLDSMRVKVLPTDVTQFVLQVILLIM